MGFRVELDVFSSGGSVEGLISSTQPWEVRLSSGYGKRGKMEKEDAGIVE